MVNKPDNVRGSVSPERGGDTQADQTREERLAAALRRNLLKRKAQSRGRSEAASAQDGEDGGPGA